MKISLEKISYQNMEAVLKLRVTEEQKSFVASNNNSIIEAYLTLAEGRQVLPFAICNENMPVGFLMIGYDYQDEDEALEMPEFVKGNYLLWRFMIDKEPQRKGYGKEALRLALDFIRTFPCGKAKCCWLSYEPENEVARKLYCSAGFEEMQTIPKGWDEIPAILKL